jgi:hypothetical protein
LPSAAFALYEAEGEERAMAYVGRESRGRPGEAVECSHFGVDTERVAAIYWKGRTVTSRRLESKHVFARRAGE